MADEQSRASFIATLEEVAGIAESCGEFAAQGVILILMGALTSDRELELFSHVREFALRERELLIAQRAQQRGDNGN